MKFRNEAWKVVDGTSVWKLKSPGEDLGGDESCGSSVEAFHGLGEGWEAWRMTQIGCGGLGLGRAVL